MLAKVKSSNKEQYLDWLSERMEPTKINDICKTYERIDTYCLNNNIIQDPLLWHRDKKTIKRVIMKIALQIIIKIISSIT